MDIVGTLKDNIKVFLPVLGLFAVIIVFYMIDLDSSSLTGITPTNQQREFENFDYKAHFYTNFGEFSIDLYQEIAPNNVQNFVSLAESSFYDGLKFHRIIQNFIIQSGDPQGDGYGGAGYYVDDEIAENLFFEEYIVAMANEGRANTNSSQFFITLRGGNFDHLDGNYTIIGRVTSGFSTVDRIGSVEVDANNFPKSDVVINRVDIITTEK